MISVCLLAYKRPEIFSKCIESIHQTADAPFELIVNCDGGSGVDEIALAEFRRPWISKLILNNGLNRGVGRSFQNCFRLAEGDIIMKTDTDLIFKKGWTSAVERVLLQRKVGAVGLFDYLNYDPKDKRFEIIEKKDGYKIVKDLVSSAYAFKRGMLPVALELSDDGMHTIIQEKGYLLAVTDPDYVENVGFGLGKSTYVVPDASGQPVKAETHREPLIFEAEQSEPASN